MMLHVRHGFTALFAVLILRMNFLDMMIQSCFRARFPITNRAYQIRRIHYSSVGVLCRGLQEGIAAKSPLEM